jgi:hypothetical protein
MINRYPAPCRYCGGTVQPESGTVDKVGQLWRAAHLPCAEMHRTEAPAAMAQIKPDVFGLGLAAA